MSTFISGVANPNTKPRRRPRPPPKPKLTKEELEAMIQQRRDDIKINIPTFLNNNPSTTLHPFLGGKIDILSESFGNKPPMRNPNIGTKNTAEASVEK
tara:strand:- start:215 stop:508 length:294 start_codon:yes stop_codon:yes gene_type:complete